MSQKIGYLMSRFPHLPETFILREMSEIERQGWEVRLFPLICQTQKLVHIETEQWLKRVHRLPLLSAKMVLENLSVFKADPLKYFSVVQQIVQEHFREPRVLIRAIALFPKAVYASRIMANERVDHIHAHYATYPALAAWIIHSFTGISYSITVHAHDIFVQRVMLAPKLKSARFIVAISEFNREFLAKHIGEWVRDKTHVVHCGIPPENFKPHSDKKVPGPRDRFRIISIGSLQPYKGQKYLIEACALLKARDVPVSCQIIGGGAEESALRADIRRLGLRSEIELLGPRSQEEVAKLLPEADCYVQPSIITATGKMEGIPVSIMEALACEIPVVATAISGIPELVIPDKTGYLVKPAQPEELADALERIYRNPEVAAKLAAAGRQLVLEEFELSTNVSRLGALFSKTGIEKYS